MIAVIAAFILWSITAFIFVVIGIVDWNAKAEVGFFTGVEPGKKKDVVGYNHAVAKIWFFYSAMLEISGIPILFIQQNSIMAIIICFLVVVLTIAIVIVYVKVDAKYKEI